MILQLKQYLWKKEAWREYSITNIKSALKMVPVGLYRDHSVSRFEPPVSFGWILDNVMDVAPMIAAFGEGEAKAAFLWFH